MDGREMDGGWRRDGWRMADGGEMDGETIRPFMLGGILSCNYCFIRNSSGRNVRWLTKKVSPHGLTRS